jgi:hypothetical protein
MVTLNYSERENSNSLILTAHEFEPDFDLSANWTFGNNPTFEYYLEDKRKNTTHLTISLSLLSVLSSSLFSYSVAYSESGFDSSLTDTVSLSARNLTKTPDVYVEKR